MPHSVAEILLTEITQEQAFAIGELLAKVWPKPEKDAAYRAAQLLKRGQDYQGTPEKAPRSLVVWEGSAVIAHSLVFERVVGTAEGPLSVLALASVASDIECRGQGLGAQVVRASFDLVDRGLFSSSLYQTSFKVEPFYEALGACRIDNPIVNSHDSENPTANPFPDEIQMRYPASADWPTGTIDLCGPSY